MSDDVESVLNELIETSIDGEKAFSKAAEDAQDPELKKLLTQCAYHCQLGASELQSQVQVQGGPPKTAGSLKGSLHRGWTGVKQALASRDDKTILEECERGEDHAKAAYKKSLAKDLPPEVRLIVERQYQGVIVNHDRVRTLRDRYRETES